METKKKVPTTFIAFSIHTAQLGPMPVFVWPSAMMNGISVLDQTPAAYKEARDRPVLPLRVREKMRTLLSLLKTFKSTDSLGLKESWLIFYELWLFSISFLWSLTLSMLLQLIHPWLTQELLEVV